MIGEQAEPFLHRSRMLFGILFGAFLNGRFDPLTVLTLFRVRRHPHQRQKPGRQIPWCGAPFDIDSHGLTVWAKRRMAEIDFS